MDEFQHAALNRWLSAVAAEVIADHLGRFHPIPAVVGAGASANDRSEAAGPPGGMVEPPHITWCSVAGYADRLPPRQREVVELRLRAGLSHREIAARLGLPVGTVRSRSARSRERLAELIATEPLLDRAEPDVGYMPGPAAGEPDRALDRPAGRDPSARRPSLTQ